MWAYHHGMGLDFSRPGKPTDHSFEEPFNGSLYDDCLNIHRFRTLTEAKQVLEAWCKDYYESRPHRSIGDLTPPEFTHSIKELEPAQWLLEPPRLAFEVARKRQTNQQKADPHSSPARL